MPRVPDNNACGHKHLPFTHKISHQRYSHRSVSPLSFTRMTGKSQLKAYHFLFETILLNGGLFLKEEYLFGLKFNTDIMFTVLGAELRNKLHIYPSSFVSF